MFGPCWAAIDRILISFVVTGCRIPVAAHRFRMSRERRTDLKSLAFVFVAILKDWNPYCCLMESILFQLFLLLVLFSQIWCTK
jgi:hypothetical protein